MADLGQRGLGAGQIGDRSKRSRRRPAGNLAFGMTERDLAGGVQVDQAAIELFVEPTDRESILDRKSVV